MSGSYLPLFWGVLLFASGLALGRDIYGKGPKEQRIASGLMTVMLGLVAFSSLVELPNAAMGALIAVQVALFVTSCVLIIRATNRRQIG